MYDVTAQTSRAVFNFFTGLESDGIWHTSIVVFSREYYCAGMLWQSDPGSTCFGDPKRMVSLGHTWRRPDELINWIVRELRPVFTYATYDVISNNCNHFSDRVSM